MKENVLITGGTGLIGTELTRQLLERGYRVSYLSRSNRPVEGVKVYQWDVEGQKLDDKALLEADYIVHLAGAGVADASWTEARKKVILESRTLSTRLLADRLAELSHQVKAFVGASAIGIYGNTGDKLVDEDSPQAEDFLAQVCQQWEKETLHIEALGLRLAIIRVGVVLSDKGGALPKLAQPVKLLAGAPLGSGKQYMSWIHIEDIAGMFLYAIEQEGMSGVYNGVGPSPVTNAEMTRIVAKTLGRPLLLPNVPAFAIKAMFGEMGQIVLDGSRISSEKAQKAGYTFRYKTAMAACANLLS